MRAVKGNKEYTIDDTQQKGYQDMGFDIMDDSGEIIAYGRGKTVPYGDHIKVVKEREGLLERLSELEEAIAEKIKSEPDKKAGTKKAGE